MSHCTHHAHVYFTSEPQHAAGMQLRAACAERFPNARIGRIHIERVAFHPAPMFQIAFEGSSAGTLVDWLSRHRQDLSILLHPVTGDVIREHLLDCIWLGPPLPINHDALRASASAAPESLEDADTQVPASMRLLRIDASARHTGSISRALGDVAQKRLLTHCTNVAVTTRDLALGLPLLDTELLAARNTPPREWSLHQRQLMAQAAQCVRELEACDAILMTVPIYNFAAPAAFKAWVDLIAQAGRTFRYTARGPQGMLPDRPVTVVITSGGTAVGGDLDYLSGWLRHVLGFMGLSSLRIVAADGLAKDPDGSLARAHAAVAELPPLQPTR